MKTMLKLLFVIFMVFFSIVPSIGQLKTTKTAVELRSLLETSSPDSNRVKLLLQLSLYYYFERDTSRVSLDSVFMYLRQAEKLSADIQSLKWQPEICAYLGKY